MSLHSLDWLLGGMTTFEGRALLSVVLLGVLGGAGWLARYLRVRADSVDATRVANAAIATGLLAITLAVGWGYIVLWELSISGLFGDPALFATRVTVTLVVLIGVYLGTGVVKRFIYEFTQQRTSISQHQTELIFRTTQVAIYVMSAVVVLGLWQVNLGGLLVGAGFLGIVVGLAARQTLGSLIAGFVLMFARPFEIGDWVAIGDQEGIVTEISIVNTRIQTFDGEYAMLPNDFVGSSQIINRTRKGRLRLHVSVGVDYDTDLELARETAKAAVTDVEEVLTVPQPGIVLTGFDDSAITLDCRFWIDKPSARRRWRAKTAVVQSIKSAFDEAGIKIPFPQRELMGRQETGGFQLGEPPAAPDDGD
ncbi:MAG: mechanosensitive ion channel family protein [Halobacteriales archaeon]|nr:mechanosensitive ion channel family protein [Halobacteriales archaeon]